MQSFMIENSAFDQLVLILKKFIIPDFRVTYIKYDFDYWHTILSVLYFDLNANGIFKNQYLNQKLC